MPTMMPTPAAAFVIEIVYAPAGATSAWRHVLSLQAHFPCTVKMALERSQVLLHFPEIDLSVSHRVGIFGRLVSMDTLLKHQDRLEIYRPLAQDPKTLRRQRAREQRKHGK